MTQDLRRLALDILHDGPNVMQDGQFVCQLAKGVINERRDTLKEIRAMIETRFSCGAARENASVALMLCAIAAELDVMIAHV